MILDFAPLNPGYDSSDSIVMKPVTTTGFVWRRLGSEASFFELAHA